MAGGSKLSGSKGVLMNNKVCLGAMMIGVGVTNELKEGAIPLAHQSIDCASDAVDV